MDGISIDLATQQLVYTDGDRTTRVPMDLETGHPRLDDRAVRWWDTPEGRVPVEDRDREWVVAAIERWVRWRASVTGETYESDAAGAVPDLPTASTTMQAADPDPRADPELDALEAWLREEEPQFAAAGLDAVPVSDNRTLLAEIDAALAELQPAADAGWDVAQSIVRQLRWCRATVAGEPAEAPPGPLSMGLMATREFDMYGDRPELADRINEIQRAMRARGAC